MEVEVIEVRVKPADFKKLQGNVVVLEKDVSDKQKMIEKLQSDLATQQQAVIDLTERVDAIEILNP